MSRLAAWVLAAVAVLALAACGRKSQPHAPENAFYPQQYPAVILPQPPPGPLPSGEAEYQQQKKREALEREKGGPQLLPPPAQPSAQPPAATTPGPANP